MDLLTTNFESLYRLLFFSYTSDFTHNDDRGTRLTHFVLGAHVPNHFLYVYTKTSLQGIQNDDERKESFVILTWSKTGQKEMGYVWHLMLLDLIQKRDRSFQTWRLQSKATSHGYIVKNTWSQQLPLFKVYATFTGYS